MNKIFKILNAKEKFNILIIICLVLITSVSEILIFLFIQPLLQIFLNINNLSYNITLLSSTYVFTSKEIFIVFLIIFFLRNFFYALTSLLKNSFIEKLYFRVSNTIYSFYLNKDYNFFLKNNSSKLISNIVNEIDNFCFRVVESFLIFFTETFLILAIILFLFLKYFTFSLVLLIFCFFLFFFSIFLFRKKIKKIGEEKYFLDQIKINDLQKSFYAIQSVKLDSAESFFINKFNKNNIRIAKFHKIYNTFTDLNKSLWEIVILAAFSISMYIGYHFFGLFRADLVLIIGTFVIAFFRFLPSLNRTFNCFNNFKFFNKSIDFIYEETFSSNFQIKENITNDFKLYNYIQLKNVSFQYNKKSQIILDAINLTIKRNSINFIKGASGMGKSTLLNIICGLLSPTQGEILADGKNINTFLKSYQSKIGYVPQKTLLSDDSILDNIIFGRNSKDYDLELLKKTINNSKLDELIDKLPAGLDTVIGERGVFLSGGEQQRIGIARALYKKPEILILDEATSALDENTERLFLQQVSEMGENMTIIIVSHKKLQIDKNVNFFELINSKIVNN
jgi:ABC-type multidrug transport system fused ATPase/permease subunit